MINISGNKQLDIILPNTNKALKEVLKGATPKELEVLTKSKDLKSVVNSLLNESAKSSASDKVLLQLLKNNPTLKDLGNVSTTIKELLNSIKANQDPLPMEKILSKFISDMKKLSDLMPNDKPATSNKNTNAQSSQTHQSELKDTLKSLLTLVDKSPSFPVKSLGTELKNLINNEALKNPVNPPSTQSLAQLSKGIDTVLRTLQSNIKDVDLSSLKDSLNSSISDKTKTTLPIEKVLKEFLTDIKQLGNDGTLKSKITDSGVFLESKLKNAQNPQVELKDTLKALQVLVEKSSVYPVKVLGKHIETMLNSETLKNASNTSLTQTMTDDKKALTQLVKGLEKIVDTLKTNIKEGDVTTTKTFNTLLEKLQHQMQPKLLTPENFKLSAIQETMQQLVPMLNKSALPEAKGLLDALVKILQIAPNTTLEQFTDKKMAQELQNAMQPLRASMSKADPLFSKDIGLLLNKLNSMASAQNLSAQNNIKEILANDLKSLLLQTSNEVAKSSHPNQAEILKNLDKLALQIDYYQLMSHLSNSSSLYLPFSWDALEQGNINLKKGEEDKFYCDIELKLKEYGELSLRLVLYEENQINIQIHSDNEEFKKIIKENISSLRSALIEAHITPREIRLLDATKKAPTSPYEAPSEKMSDGINVGFEIKA
ncbi:flagellar hook-length control protein FliK [Sulfurimonas sp.]|uniref:flagellar hook-length control protein FliK n=1 Tax=Sulfurimonas sp. TaxID=2022749 RepID=UPI00356269F2